MNVKANLVKTTESASTKQMITSVDALECLLEKIAVSLNKIRQYLFKCLE